MMIDLPLIRLRYEILNIPLDELANEINVPLSTLQKEAESQGWNQWWPAEAEIAFQEQTSQALSPSSTPLDKAASEAVPDTQPDQLEDDTAYDEVTFDTSESDDFDDLSPLEEGAQTFLKDNQLRLKVFELAKQIHFAHKYAVLESRIIDQAESMVSSAATTSDVRNLVLSLKDLPGKIASGSLTLGLDDSGMPTVIIKDLSGRA